MSGPEPIAIPAPDVAGLTLLRDIDELQFESLVSALDGAAFPTNAEQMIAYVAAEVEPHDADAHAIVGTLISLAGMVYWREEDVAEIVGRIVASEQVTDATGSTGPLAERLLRLLGHRTLRLTGKSEVIARQNERQFLDGHVITDVRPVFDAPADEALKPVAALIMHTLTLQYIADLRMAEISVTMNDEDLRALAQTIDRARSKHRALTEFFAGVPLPMIASETA